MNHHTHTDDITSIGVRATAMNTIQSDAIIISSSSKRRRRRRVVVGRHKATSHFME